MESGRWYNAEVLVRAYLGLGGLYAVVGHHSAVFSVVFPVLVAGRLFLHPDDSIAHLSCGVIAVVTLTANALFWIFYFGLRRSTVYCRLHSLLSTKYQSMMGFLLVFLYVLVLHGNGWFRVVTISFLFVYYLMSVLAIPSDSDTVSLGGNSSSAISQLSGSKHLAFAAWTFPLLPILTTGHLYASFLRPHKIISGNWALVLIPCLRNVLARHVAQRLRLHDSNEGVIAAKLSFVLALVRVGIFVFDFGTSVHLKEGMGSLLVKIASVDVVDNLRLLVLLRGKPHQHAA